MRFLWLFSASFLLLAACGGGGGGGDANPGLQLTKTSGNVTSLNGESGNVVGIQIRVPEVGAEDTTGTDGKFDLGNLPAGEVEVVVSPPSANDSRVMVDLSGGGKAVLRMTIDESGVSRMSVERCDGDDSENETSAPLLPLELGLDGEVEIEKEGDGDQEFEVEAEDLAPGRVVEICITNLENTTQSLGQFAADGEGEVELELKTEDGDTLPFGVFDVEELEGFTVEVKDASDGTTILMGTVPELGSVPEPCDEDDDGDDDGDDLEGESRLTNSPGILGKGEVEIESEDDEEEFEVEVENTNVVDTIQVWLEDPNAAGTFVMIGVLVEDDDDENELEFEIETDDGGVLPFGVSGVADLVGLQIELRAASDGAVLYFGVVPPLNPS